MKVTRSRRVRAPTGRVWGMIADAHQLPRWWPRTTRVEGVSSSGWTSVLVSDRGRSVRMDWRVEQTDAPRLRVFSQELAGSPFERLMDSHHVRLRLAPDDDGSRIEIEIERRLRGWARMAPFLVRRAARQEADGALAGLAAAVERD